MSKERKIINPLELKDFPVFVFSDDLRSSFSFGIKVRTQGNYSHTMIMVFPQEVVTQGLTYKEIPLKDYLKSRYILKFWYYTKITQEEKRAIFEAVYKDLHQSWYKRSYDFLGVLGYALNIRWLQNPAKKYCSERVAAYLRLISAVKDKIPLRPSPTELNAILKSIPEMKILGYWLD